MTIAAEDKTAIQWANYRYSPSAASAMFKDLGDYVNLARKNELTRDQTMRAVGLVEELTELTTKLSTAFKATAKSWPKDAEKSGFGAV